MKFCSVDQKDGEMAQRSRAEVQAARQRFERLHTGTSQQGEIFVARTPDDLDFLLDVLLHEGFHVQSEDDRRARLVRPKRLGPQEVFAIVFGLFLCILPGLIWMMNWARKGPDVAIIEINFDKVTQP